MDAVWIPVIAISGSFIMVVAIVFLGSRAKERTARYRADVQMKMIERFGSAAEFTRPALKRDLVCASVHSSRGSIDR